MGARLEPGERHGCVEAVHSTAGRQRTLVGSRLNRRRPMWALYRRACGRLGDAVSSRSAGSKYTWALGLVWHPVALLGCDDTEFVTLGDRDRCVTVLTVLSVERDFHRK